MWKIRFHPNRAFWWLSLVTRMSRKLTAWLDCVFLSYSAPVIVTLQFLACFTHVPPWRLASHKIRSQDSFDLYTSWVFFTFFHSQPLHDSHLNIGYLIAKIQANLIWNKANTWLNKFSLTNRKQKSMVIFLILNFKLIFILIAL